MSLKTSEKWAILITLLFLALVLGYHLGQSSNSVRVVVTELNAASAAPVLSGEADDADEKININTATAEELETLQGIGPVLAQRIVDYREANGDFRRIEDIAFVSGIASETYEAIRDIITVE